MHLRPANSDQYNRCFSDSEGHIYQPIGAALFLTWGVQIALPVNASSLGTFKRLLDVALLSLFPDRP